MLLREHRFTFLAGTETYLFRIEELVRGLSAWPHRFRLRLPAGAGSEAKTIYGASCYEVAEKGADLIAINIGYAEETGAPHPSAWLPDAPRALQIQRQESDSSDISN
jgi:hypothetical protein